MSNNFLICLSVYYIIFEQKNRPCCSRLLLNIACSVQTQVLFVYLNQDLKGIRERLLVSCEESLNAMLSYFPVLHVFCCHFFSFFPSLRFSFIRQSQLLINMIPVFTNTLTILSGTYPSYSHRFITRMVKQRIIFIQDITLLALVLWFGAPSLMAFIGALRLTGEKLLTADEPVIIIPSPKWPSNTPPCQ